MCDQAKETPHKNNSSINQCPCCGRPTKEHFGQTTKKRPPFAYLLRQEIKRMRGKPEGRDWRTDPHPGDCIAVLDRAYYSRPTSDERGPTHREVVRVSDTRVFLCRRRKGTLTVLLADDLATVGCRLILVRSGYGLKRRKELTLQPFIIRSNASLFGPELFCRTTIAKLAGMWQLNNWPTLTMKPLSHQSQKQIILRGGPGEISLLDSLL